MTFKMQLTDGTTTIDIIQTATDSRVGYHLKTNSYTPQINRRNQTGFGDVYLPVDETFTIAIVGSSANDVHVKLAALVNLIDNVQLWADSDAAAADAVNYIYKPLGSTETVDYRALVIGNASVNYSQTIDRVAAWFRMPNVTVSFSRGIWLGDEETAVSSAAVQPSVLQATFASSAALASPVDVQISISASGSGTGDSLTHVSPTPILFYEAESLTLGSGTSTAAIAKASGGSVAEMTALNVPTSPPTGVPPKGYKSFPYSTDPLPYKDFMIVGLFRNKAAIINWTVETVVSIGSLASWQSNAVSGIYQLTKTTIEAGSVNPRIVNLGIFSFDELYTDTVDSWIEFRCTCDDVDFSGASDLEFDCWAIIPIDIDATGFISTYGAEKTKYGNNGRVLTHPSGKVYSSFASPVWPNVAAPYTGDGRLSTVDDDLYGIHFFVYGATDGWRHHGTGTTANNTLTATRRLTSLTPK